MALKNATPIAAGIATDPAPKRRTGTCRPGAQRGEAERGPEHRQPMHRRRSGQACNRLTIQPH